MEVYRIVDPSFDSNLYLVMSEEVALIDSGTGRGREAVLQQIEEKLEGAPLNELILTHRHVDHVGGARSVASTYDLVPKISVDDAAALLQADQRSTGATLFGMELEPMEVEVLPYGQAIDLGGSKLEVIHTPGHTIGSICLWCEDGSLFTGDTIFAYGGIGRWDMETGSLKDLLSSLKRLEPLQVETLYPGHGPAVQKEAAEHISMAIEMAEAYSP
ncbi:MAG: MBL fold metallo-hydrolase [Thermoplasmata archaeon]